MQRGLESLEPRRLLAFTNPIELELGSDDVSLPVVATHAGDGSGRLFIVEQAGRIRIFENGAFRATPFLDLTGDINFGGEQGLLGLAFHPDYDTPGAAGEGRFYVYYNDPTTVQGQDHDCVVSEFRVSPADLNVANEASERILLRFPQPFGNHNGGDLEFGPDDGLLYISTGDGGSGNDPFNNAQNRGLLLGKILRIDVLGSNGATGQYGIPATNPFVGQAGVRAEIYAYGFRNPFRMSFDNGPNGELSPDRLFVGDVGQNGWEEVDLVTAGGNYGWRIREGAHPNPGIIPADPDPGNLIDPIAEYDNPELGRAVIGGIVYRGQQYASLQGIYLFGDLLGRMFVLEESRGEFLISQPTVVGGNPIGAQIYSIGADEAGELYVLTSDSLLHVTVNEPPPPAAPWQNPGIFQDVDNDGEVSASDALALILRLREGNSPDLPPPTGSFAPPPYYDPNGDNLLTLADVLEVVKRMREQAAIAGEDEPDQESINAAFALGWMDNNLEEEGSF